ncbi:1010_t:CDS:1, partial [Gigaspora margarita]
MAIRVNDHDECYVMIKGVFKHRNNNDCYYPFVYVEWFEYTSRKYIK